MTFQWTRRAIERLVWRTLEGESCASIAARLGCHERTARDMQIELELVTPQSKQPWTSKEQALLRRLYPDTCTAAIAKELGRTVGPVYQQAAQLGLRKSLEFVRRTARERTARPDHPSAAFRYSKGHVPANKGLRRPGWAPGRMSATQFRRGERHGAAAQKWMPVGTIRTDNEGFLRVKVREWERGENTGFGNTGIWPLLNRHTWEQHHGPIPDGHKVAFRDGNRSNTAIENLELISYAEMMRRNSVHRYPKEIADAIQYLGAVKRKLRERNEKHNDRPTQPSV